MVPNIYPGLLDDFRIKPGMRIAIVGSGGKTSTMIQIAKQLGKGVVLTTTTHIGSTQIDAGMRHRIIGENIQIPLKQLQLENHITLITSDPIDEFRCPGPPKVVMDELAEWVKANNLTMLIEADGSRGIPIKAPAKHEPVIPSWVDMVIVVVGSSALGQPFSENTVHRLAEYETLSGISTGDVITPQVEARVLTHQNGGLKNIPNTAQKVLLLNQADTDDVQSAAHQVANLTVGIYNRVLIASMNRLAPPQIFARYEPVAGILLAAGGSTRLGEPKQLLEKDGIPLVRRMAITGLNSGLDPLIVVTGANQEKISQALAGLPVQIVDNSGWQGGQGTSVAAGVRVLPENSGGAVFLLSDQPFVTETLIRKILHEAASTRKPVIAPMAGGKRANPVYFDRVTFTELEKLTGETGGRALFSKYSPYYFDWHDDRILLDLDTPEDVLRWQEMKDE